MKKNKILIPGLALYLILSMTMVGVTAGGLPSGEKLLETNENYYMNPLVSTRAYWSGLSNPMYHNMFLSSSVSAHLKDAFNVLGQVDEAGTGAFSFDVAFAHDWLDLDWDNDGIDRSGDPNDPANGKGSYPSTFVTEEIVTTISLINVQTNAAYNFQSALDENRFTKSNVQTKFDNIHLGGTSGQFVEILSFLIEKGIDRLSSPYKEILNAGKTVLKYVFTPDEDEIDISAVSASASDTGISGLEIRVRPDSKMLAVYSSMNINIPSSLVSNNVPYNIIITSTIKMGHQFQGSSYNAVYSAPTMRMTTLSSHSSSTTWNYNRIVKVDTSALMGNSYTISDYTYGTGALKSSYMGTNWFIVPGRNANDASKIALTASYANSNSNWIGWYVDGVKKTSSRTYYLDVNDEYYTVKPVYEFEYSCVPSFFTRCLVP